MPGSRFSVLAVLGWCAAAAAFALAAPAVVGAGAQRAGARAAPDPPVRVERVLTTTRDLRRGGLLRAITGKKPRPLFVRPYGAAFVRGDLLVTDPSAGRVVRITARGRMQATPANLLRGPLGIADCARGPVVTDSRAGLVMRLRADLRAGEILAEGLDRPTGIVCGVDRVFFAETGRHRVVVLELDASGSVRTRRTLGGRGDGPGQLNFPTALALADDRLWVGDTLNFRVQAFDVRTGEATASFGQLGDSVGDMPRLKGLAVDEQGNLWLSDAHLDQLSVFGPEGRLLLVVGGSGSAPGRFSFPAGLASDGAGRLAVVDSLNRRVQLLETRDLTDHADVQGEGP